MSTPSVLSETGTASLSEAISEVAREVNVRKRCFDRWIAEGKITYIDGRDRYNRLLSALHFLNELSQEHDDPTAPLVPVPNCGDLAVPPNNGTVLHSAGGGEGTSAGTQSGGTHAPF